MSTAVRKLLSISGPALCADSVDVPPTLISDIGCLKKEYINLLELKNGFYAFEGALHVFPSGCEKLCMDVVTWNQTESWRGGYGEAAAGYIFFAEDIFGFQFALKDGLVFRFDPETAAAEALDSSLELWASRILDRPNYETGYELVHKWQELNGPLPEGQRLLPKTPFFLGGAFDIRNLYSLDSLTGMELRADIYQQTKDVPDGAKVRLNFV